MLLAVANQRAPNQIWEVWANKTQVGLNDTLVFTIRGQNTVPGATFGYTIYEEEYPARVIDGAPLSKLEQGTFKLQNDTATIGFRTMNVTSSYPTRRVRIVLHTGAEGTVIVPVVGPQLVTEFKFTVVMADYRITEHRSGSVSHSKKTLNTLLPAISNVTPSAGFGLYEFNSSGRMETTVGHLQGVHNREWNDRNKEFHIYSLDTWVAVPEAYADENFYTVDVKLPYTAIYTAHHVKGQPYGGVFGESLTPQQKAHTNWIVLKIPNNTATVGNVKTPMAVTISVSKK